MTSPSKDGNKMRPVVAPAEIITAGFMKELDNKTEIKQLIYSGRWEKGADSFKDRLLYRVNNYL